MESSFYHLQVNVNIKNKAWYGQLMEALGWTESYDDETMLGFSDPSGVSIWFSDAEVQKTQNYDAFGTNHISIKVGKQSDVDEIEKVVKEMASDMLFETPKHRPEFVRDATETYYQIMFESPDGILFEVVYVGKKS